MPLPHNMCIYTPSGRCQRPSPLLRDRAESTGKLGQVKILQEDRAGPTIVKRAVATPPLPPRRILSANRRQQEGGARTSAQSVVGDFSNNWSSSTDSWKETYPLSGRFSFFGLTMAFVLEGFFSTCPAAE